MPLSWIGSSLRAFCRDSEPVLPVLIPLPGLGAEHLCSERLCQVWKATEISLRLNLWAPAGRSEVVVCLGLAAGHRWQRKAEKCALTRFNPSCWRWDMSIEKLKGWLGQRVEVCLADDETHFSGLNVSWTGWHLRALWPERPAPTQTPTSRRQVPSTLSWGRVRDSKRVGTMAEMLRVGEITLGERPENGNKRGSPVESWKRKEKIPLRSGERRKRYHHRCQFSRRGQRLPWSLAGHFGRSWQGELADSVALAPRGGEEIPAPVLLRKAPFEYSRSYIPGIYWRACENKGGKLTLDVE